MNVLVAGGSGFVGRSLCRVLDERGHAVTAASRSPDVPGLPDGVETATVDVRRPDLSDAVAGHDAVVNLVALPSHVRPRGQTHESVHLDGTRHLLAASEATGVERFVQMSGLGVESDAETAYLVAKRRAEALVRTSSLDHVIYRPSVVVGDGCAFVPFVRRVIPPVVAPLPGGGRMRIQPIWVGDLAPMLADGVEGTSTGNQKPEASDGGVEDDRHVGATYELGGPERLTFAAVVRQICGPRVVVPVPMPVAAVAFGLAEHVPGVPLGRDQSRVFGLDNTTAANDVEAFGVDEEALMTLGEYLADERTP